MSKSTTTDLFQLIKATSILTLFTLVFMGGAGCAATGGATGQSTPLPPIRVEGARLVAGGREVRLRGVNWGWWHDAGTVYTEREAERMAQWSANLMRLPFSYKDVESDARDGTLEEAKVRDIDEVVGWSARHGLYVILDMHECPGGQTPVSYSDGGGNRLWSDEGCQARYVALWRALAARYRDETAVAAYELMNEPVTQRQGPAPHMAVVRRAAAAVRAVAPEKTIVRRPSSFPATTGRPPAPWWMESSLTIRTSSTPSTSTRAGAASSGSATWANGKTPATARRTAGFPSR